MYAVAVLMKIQRIMEYNL